MDCMPTRALKSNFRRELAGKATQPAFLDDLWCLNGSNGVSGEEFSVDDLLDFSNGDLEDSSVGEEDEPEKDSGSASCSSNFSNLSAADEPLLSGQLAVPAEDLAELEWVSHFVDDSVSDFSFFNAGVKEKTHNQIRLEPELRPVETKPPCFPSPIPSKTRTKRARTTSCLWSTPLTDLSSSSSSPFSLTLINPVHTVDVLHNFIEPPPNKQKKRGMVQTRGLSGGIQFQRQCSHCQVQKTPQWRTGPLGAKTLCNACGVRYKSGRLFPEYRPACSPTFSGDVNSNSHRKVLEMRKKKEVVGPDTGLSQMIPSFFNFRLEDSEPGSVREFVRLYSNC